MKVACVGAVLAILLVGFAGCNGGPADTSQDDTVHAGKIDGTLVGENLGQYANMPVRFMTKDGTTYSGTVSADGASFSMTAPPGSYTVVVGTAQTTATIEKGSNTVKVNVAGATGGPEAPTD